MTNPLILVVLLSASLVGDDSVNPACKADKRVTGACFRVHGLLSSWNGNPTRRIWIIGTKRMFGLREGTNLPPMLDSKMGDFDDTATANFEVCPFTPASPGRMQVGCVASVSNIKMSKRKP